MNKNTISSVNIPPTIDNKEKIVRNIYSPINLSKNGKKISYNLYKPLAGTDEVSVNRLDYIATSFLKKLAKKNQNKEKGREYYGFSLLKAHKIREHNFNIMYSPIKSNPFHSDIKIRYIVKKGKPLPPEISSKLKKMILDSKIYIDPAPDVEKWIGEELE